VTFREKLPSPSKSGTGTSARTGPAEHTATRTTECHNIERGFAIEHLRKSIDATEPLGGRSPER
jgi:hypothetical protein